MKKVASAFILLASTSGAALAAPQGLELTSGKVLTDPAGAFVSVQVKNTGTIVLAQIVVSCEFFTAKNKSLGTSSTTLFSTVPGVTGADQVRLMGATSATSAKCAITSPAN